MHQRCWVLRCLGIREWRLWESRLRSLILSWWASIYHKLKPIGNKSSMILPQQISSDSEVRSIWNHSDKWLLIWPKQPLHPTWREKSSRSWKSPASNQKKTFKSQNLNNSKALTPPSWKQDTPNSRRWNPSCSDRSTKTRGIYNCLALVYCGGRKYWERETKKLFIANYWKSKIEFI